MPSKAKITREMILYAALAITRKEGFEAVNARPAGALYPADFYLLCRHGGAETGFSPVCL